MTVYKIEIVPSLNVSVSKSTPSIGQQPIRLAATMVRRNHADITRGKAMPYTNTKNNAELAETFPQQTVCC